MLLAPIFWIVPTVIVGHFVVAEVVDVEVPELALVVLPQAASSTAKTTTGITAMSFFIVCLLYVLNHILIFSVLRIL